eukprot:3937853-Rhodomonas_salina.2
MVRKRKLEDGEQEDVKPQIGAVLWKTEQELVAEAWELYSADAAHPIQRFRRRKRKLVGRGTASCTRHSTSLGRSGRSGYTAWHCRHPPPTPSVSPLFSTPSVDPFLPPSDLSHIHISASYPRRTPVPTATKTCVYCDGGAGTAEPPTGPAPGAVGATAACNARLEAAGPAPLAQPGVGDRAAPDAHHRAQGRGGAHRALGGAPGRDPAHQGLLAHGPPHAPPRPPRPHSTRLAHVPAASPDQAWLGGGACVAPPPPASSESEARCSAWERSSARASAGVGGGAEGGSRRAAGAEAEHE